MQIKVSVCRKEGRPNYGSEGATCEILLDVAERSVSESPGSLVDEIRRAYALCDQAVAEQLGRNAGGATPALPAPRQPEPAPPADRYPHADPGHKGYDGWPRSGRELYPFARKREESGDQPGLIKRLVAYGQACGFPDRMTGWSREQVDQGLRSTLRSEEPAPAGRNGTNGYHN